LPTRSQECEGELPPIERLRFGVWRRVNGSCSVDLPSQNPSPPGILPFAALAILAGISLSACTVGPDYVRPAAPTSAQFKEAKGWKITDPSDTLDRGAWWALYKDQRLSSLISQVEISNETVKADVAAYDEAVAIIREAQAGYFPTVSASYTATDAHQGSGATTTNGITAGRSFTNAVFNPVANATWDLDVWGRIRRTVESNAAAAQVSAADLQNAKLSEQAALATAYFNLRAEDSLKTLFDRSVVAYQKTLDITRNQFNAGYSGTTSVGGVTAADVAAAQALVQTTEAEAIATDVLRAQYEHAIAVLVGRPPADLTVARGVLAGRTPHIPATVPSLLLERRPDIAAAERQLQEENALIGVAVANFYPDINLTGMFGFAGPTPLPISVADEAWSIAGNATQTLFDGGLLSSQLAAARAVYQESVANYRQTVLTAFQQVEDELAAVRILAKELAVQEAAAKNEGTAVQVYLNQYQQGLVNFTTVVTAENTQLADEITAIEIRQSLFVASVALVEALGGGWDASLLPSLNRLSTVPTLTPPL
jgi:NodT family efflux transporter outer membrane factor (OMF) lipoprotein